MKHTVAEYQGYLPEFSHQIDDEKKLWLRNLIQLARQ
jgi:hypothetical protein